MALKALNRNKGFTLIELMIVVVVVSILSAIAIPMYKDYVIRARIMKAIEGLSARQVQMEQCFQDNHKYVDTCPKNCTVSGGEDFDFSCAVEDNSFVLTATGTGTMAGFEYTVTEQNARTSKLEGSGWNGGGACWATKKGQTC